MLFSRQKSDVRYWVNWTLWFYIIFFVVCKVVAIWFGTHFLETSLCLKPYAIFNLQLWRYLTYGFLHVDFWHLFFNMLLFYGLARFLLTYELTLKKFFILYFLGIIAGGVFWSLLHLNQPYYTLIGASAGVTTLFTYFCCLYPEKTMTLLLFFVIPCQIKARWCFYLFALYEMVNFLFYETQGMTTIAHSAHLGGMLIGFLAVKYQCYRETPSKSRYKPTDKQRYCVHYETHNVIKDVPFNLLNKIEQQGLDALSPEEREWLESYRK